MRLWLPKDLRLLYIFDYLDLQEAGHIGLLFAEKDIAILVDFLSFHFDIIWQNLF